MDKREAFEAERPRLVALARRVLGDHAEAEGMVQQARLRQHGREAEIESLPAWLTTVTTPEPRSDDRWPTGRWSTPS